VRGPQNNEYALPALTSTACPCNNLSAEDCPHGSGNGWASIGRELLKRFPLFLSTEGGWVMAMKKDAKKMVAKVVKTEKAAVKKIVKKTAAARKAVAKKTTAAKKAVTKKAASAVKALKKKVSN
jgi:hypothetical protein